MSHFITLNQAVAMTSTFRENREEILIPDLQGSDILPICQTYDRAAVDKLLSNENCLKVRIYFGMDEGKKVHAVIVGVNENDEDILPEETETEETPSEDDEIVIVNEGVLCPPNCPPPSVLNP